MRITFSLFELPSLVLGRSHTGSCKAAPLPSVKACGDHGQLPGVKL